MFVSALAIMLQYNYRSHRHDRVRLTQRVTLTTALNPVRKKTIEFALYPTNCPLNYTRLFIGKIRNWYFGYKQRDRTCCILKRNPIL